MGVYSHLSNNELLEHMDDYGNAHEIIHEAAKRIRELMAAVPPEGFALRQDAHTKSQNHSPRREALP